MNFDLKTLPNLIKPLLLKISRYKMLIFALLLIGVYGWLLFRINSFSNIEPSEDSISQKLQSSQRPRIDKAALEKIQKLQDNSVEVQTLFKQARDNPFQE